jgi:uncharacterized membrane protein YsdA (DUF1294 family)
MDALTAPYLQTGFGVQPLPVGSRSQAVPPLQMGTRMRLILGFLQLAIAATFTYLWIAMHIDKRTASRLMWYVLAAGLAVLTGILTSMPGESHVLLAIFFLTPVINIILFETYLCDQDVAPRKLKTIRTMAIALNGTAIALLLWSIIQYGFRR